MSNFARIAVLVVAAGVSGSGATAQQDGPAARTIPATAANVRQQIERLASRDPTERATAACLLGHMRERAVEAIPALIRLLGDDTRIGLLPCRTGTPYNDEVAEQWKRMRTTPGKEAAESLSEIGPAAIAPLERAAKGADPTVQRNAECALRLLGRDVRGRSDENERRVAGALRRHGTR